jgi:hypothetical protein
MKRTCFLPAMVTICQAALWAQTPPGATAFQQAQSLGEPLGPIGGRGGRGGRGGAAISVPIPRPETGRPFSATAVTQTTQTFSDGMHVSQTLTMVQYRDAEGRVRTETNEPASSNSEPVKSIVIRDTVAGMTYRLDPARKTAVKLVIVTAGGPPIVGGRGARGGRNGAPVSNSDITALRPRPVHEIDEAAKELAAAAAAIDAARSDPNHMVEDLGMKTVNGVAARGTRLATVVPVGAIGNDKEFRSITERWFSPDLNLLVKSVSSDPRFGTTTYELTNISRQAPDSSLFQVPPDYNIVSNTRQ